MIEKAKEALSSFLDCWISEDYKEMEKHVQLTWLSGRGNTCHKQLQRSFRHRQLERYEILPGIQPLGTKARVDFQVKVWLKGANDPFLLERAVVICEFGPYMPSIKGDWGVNPVSVLRMGQA